MDAGGWSLDRVQKYIAGRVFSEADRYVLSRLQSLGPATLIELGCGPGIILRRADFIKNYICTDLSIHFLRALGQNGSTSGTVCCDGCELPFMAGTADCVLGMAVLHHLDCISLGRALREIRRVLKPGGVFILLEDWCFSRGATPFDEEARKCRFKYGSRENHLALGSWLLELRGNGFRCDEPVWVKRPFQSGDIHLPHWPAEERTVRMCCFEAVKLR